MKFRTTQAASRIMPRTAGRSSQFCFLVLDLGRQRVDQTLELLVGLGPRVASEMPAVSTKQTMKAKVASQKFWAISLGKVCSTAR